MTTPWPPPRQCSTCGHWQPTQDRSTAYLAWCPEMQRRTQFDEGKECPSYVGRSTTTKLPPMDPWGRPK